MKVFNLPDRLRWVAETPEESLVLLSILELVGFAAETLVPDEVAQDYALDAQGRLKHVSTPRPVENSPLYRHALARGAALNPHDRAFAGRN